MRQDLELVVGSGERTVGDTKQWRLARKLVVRLPGGSLTFAEPGRPWQDPAPDTPWVPDHPEALPVLRDALYAWKLVRESVDCPECDDHWQRDRLVLSR